jgi:hypothetical protein
LKMRAKPSTSRKRKRSDTPSTTSHRRGSPESVGAASNNAPTPPHRFAEFHQLFSQERGKKKEKEEWPLLMNLVSAPSVIVAFLY